MSNKEMTTTWVFRSDANFLDKITKKLKLRGKGVALYKVLELFKKHKLEAELK